MNLRYLNLRNCRHLLPAGSAISQALPAFDDFLDSVNTSSDERGLISKLLAKNQSSSGGLEGRLFHYDADVGLEYDQTTARLSFQFKPYYRHPELQRKRKDQRVVAQFWTTYLDGTRWGYKVPLQALLKHWGDARDGYMCYIHTIEVDDGSLSYAGITKRNWLTRLAEHLAEMNRDSKKLFHAEWRRSLGLSQVSYGSELLDFNLSEEQAFSWEEWFVDEFTLHPKGLNMIPGGKKGLQYLYRLRLIGSTNISPDARDRALEAYARKNPSDIRSYQYLEDLWRDDVFYWRIIDARANTLSVTQIREARYLAANGHDVSSITLKVGALNEIQIKNLLTGRTYSRVE
jgi:hypothetical protein